MGSMEEYRIFETSITPFLLFNAAGTLSCAVWFISLFVSKRYLFVKPSMFVLSATHIFFQWPSLLFAGYVEVFLPDSLGLSLFVHGYVLIGLLISSNTAERISLDIWNSLSQFWQTPKNSLTIVTCALGGTIGSILIAYFCVVPFNATGIYAAIFDPSKYDDFRTASFENLPTVLRYGFRLMADAACPILAGVFASIGATCWRRRKLSVVLVCLAGVFALAILNGITGARYDSVKLLAASILAVAFLHHLPFQPFRLAFLTLAILVPAALMTLLRENQALSLTNSLSYLFDHILFHRVLVTPFQVGVWYVQFSQLVEQLGISAIPKLAALMEIDSTVAPAIIGKIYVPHPTFESHCNGGFLLTYYSYFGAIAFPICVALLLALDSMLYLYRFVSPSLRAPCLAASLMCTLDLVQTDYTTVLLSHGVFFVVLLGIVVEIFMRQIQRRLNQSPLV